MMSGGYERHIVNNTIYDVDSGVNIATPVGSLDVADNIIANVTRPRPATCCSFERPRGEHDAAPRPAVRTLPPRLGQRTIHLSDSQLPPSDR